MPGTGYHPGQATSGSPYTSQGLYSGTYTTSGLEGSTMMVCPWVVTFSCAVLFRSPAVCARCRMTCTAFITSCCCFTYASPSAEVQEGFLSSFVRTEGKGTSAFTLSSHDCA